MKFIRLPDNDWRKVWWALVASGPISRVNHERIYSVSDEQVKMLRRKKLPFTVVPPPNGHPQGPRHG
jgi:hypothetical protein